MTTGVDAVDARDVKGPFVIRICKGGGKPSRSTINVNRDINAGAGLVFVNYKSIRTNLD